MTFRAMPDRVVGELARRQNLAARALQYHHTFLDDYLRAILPHDLILLGAPSGLGKTDLALAIATANARNEIRAHFLALEAEPDELERRIKYARLCHAVFTDRHPRAHEMNFTDWYLGRVEDICGPYNAAVERSMEGELASCFTFYRGQKFGATELARTILEISDETDLIVIDHLHYVDVEDSEDENRAVTDLIQTIRDLTLRIGKPCLVVAHLRKKDERSHKLVPTLGDFHGSSNITKVCTQAVTLERASDVEAPKWYLSPTYMAILKDRRSGAPPYVALLNFDMRTRSYVPEYTLGRAKGRSWDEVTMTSVPSWARHHRPLTKEGAPTKQAPLQLAQPPADDIPHAASDPQARFDSRGD